MRNRTLTSVIVAILLLVAAEISSTTSEENVSVPSQNKTNLQTNDVKDSPLEHIQVKQETGFDGNVRAIRFYSNKKNWSKVQANDNSTTIPTDTDEASTSTESNTENSVSPSSTVTESSRLKRGIEKSLSDNELDDLVAEESKVFRPLFVYRQQVARRLKLRNDRRSGYDRRIYQKTKPNNYGYYPYQYYPNYYYYPYRYPPFHY